MAAGGCPVLQTEVTRDSDLSDRNAQTWILPNTDNYHFMMEVVSPLWLSNPRSLSRTHWQIEFLTCRGVWRWPWLWWVLENYRSMRCRFLKMPPWIDIVDPGKPQPWSLRLVPVNTPFATKRYPQFYSAPKNTKFCLSHPNKRITFGFPVDPSRVMGLQVNISQH